MPYTIGYEESRFILIDVTGTLKASDVHQMIIDTAKMVKSTNCYHVLSDYQKAEIVGSTTEIFKMTNTFIEEMKREGIEYYKVKRAIIVSKNIEDFKFYETASRNKGQLIGIFENRNKGIEWLSGMEGKI